MRKLRILAISWSIAALAVGATWAQDEQTYPSGPDYGDAFELPDISGEFNPMAVSTQDVAYDGNGSVDIPFTINQRATVWVVIYRKGSSENRRAGAGRCLAALRAPRYVHRHHPGSSLRSR